MVDGPDRFLRSVQGSEYNDREMEEKPEYDYEA